MEPLSLRRLQHFVAVAEAGSIAAAAGSLNLAASALSVSLKELERTTGVTLLIRRAGEGVVLTPEGVQLLAGARELLSAADDVRQRIATDAVGVTAPLTVGALSTVAALVLPRIVQAHARRHPEVTLDIRTGTQDALIDWLGEGAIHVAVTYDLGLDRHVAFEPVITAAPHVALRADHPLAGAASVALKELAGEPFIALDLPLSREYFFALLLRDGVELRPRHSVGDIDLMRSAVGNGLGWGLVNLVPPRTINIDGSKVAYVRVRTKHPPLRLGMMTLPGRRQPASAAALYDTVRRTVREVIRS